MRWQWMRWHESLSRHAERDAGLGSVGPRLSSANWWASWASRRCSARGELSLEPSGQIEERKDPLGIQEEGELHHPPIEDLEYLQRPRLVATPRLARLVLPEGGRAVGIDGWDHPRPATPRPMPQPEAEDALAAT